MLWFTHLTTEKCRQKENIAGYRRTPQSTGPAIIISVPKIAYTDADDESDGIITFDNETRYLGGPETPLKTLRFSLGGMTGGVAGGNQKFYNTSD